MEIFFHELDRDVLILSADGGLNAQTGAEFLRQLDVLVDAGLTKIIVDCTHLEFISSYGVGLLVRLHHKLAGRGGDVKIAAPHSMVLQAMNVMRLGEIFGIYSDVNRARLAFREKSKPGGEMTKLE